MKRYTALLLILALFLCLTACAREDNTIREPVSFYYRRAELTYGSSDSVILSESSDAAGHTDDLIWLLGEYLKGPQSENLLQTFPSGTTLVSLTVEEGTATIVLSVQFGRLTGMDLTVACACLTKTVLGLTDAETVVIQAVNTDLDGAQQIVMDESSLLMLDESAKSTD